MDINVNDLTTPEGGAFDLKVSLSTFRRLVERGELTPVAILGRSLFRRADVAALAARRAARRGQLVPAE